MVFMVLSMKDEMPIYITIAVIVLVFLGLLFIPKLYTKLFPKQSYDDRYTYNYFDFINVDGSWSTQTQEGNNLLMIILRHGPLELEGMPVKGDIQRYRNDNDFFYITFDPRNESHDPHVTLSMAELAPNLVRHFGKDFAPACTVDNPDCNESGVETVTCNSTDKAVIFLHNGEGPSIKIDGNCAVISGLGEDLVRATDRFMYGMYGIMK